jgi:hypothetical protein
LLSSARSCLLRCILLLISAQLSLAQRSSGQHTA